MSNFHYHCIEAQDDTLEFEDQGDSFLVSIESEGDPEIVLAKDDAHRLALELLENSGHEPKQDGTHIEKALFHLLENDREELEAIEEAATAQLKTVIEATALRLYNANLKHRGLEQVEGFEDQAERERDTYIAMAESLFVIPVPAEAESAAA